MIMDGQTSSRLRSLISPECGSRDQGSVLYRTHNRARAKAACPSSLPRRSPWVELYSTFRRVDLLGKTIKPAIGLPIAQHFRFGGYAWGLRWAVA